MYYIKFNKDYEDFIKGEIYIFYAYNYNTVNNHYSLYKDDKVYHIPFIDLDLITYMNIKDYRKQQINKL